MISNSLHDEVINRDKVCIYCVYMKYWKGEDIEVNQAVQVHHIVKKKWLNKKHQRLLDTAINLVGVCESCHYKRLVDNMEATVYFVWYLTKRLGLPFREWYAELPMLEKENIIEF